MPRKQALADVKTGIKNANLFANVTAELVATPESAKDLLSTTSNGKFDGVGKPCNLLLKDLQRFGKSVQGPVLCGLMQKIDSTIPNL